MADHVSLLAETGNCAGDVPVRTRGGAKVHVGRLEWPLAAKRQRVTTKCGVKLGDTVPNARIPGGRELVNCANCRIWRS
jgi:hypothetical protein